MTSTTLRILLYALVAATSPLALAATLAVLRSKRGRINGAALGIVLVVESLTFLL